MDDPTTLWKRTVEIVDREHERSEHGRKWFVDVVVVECETETEFGRLVAQVAQAWPTVLCPQDVDGAELGKDACQR